MGRPEAGATLGVAQALSIGVIGSVSGKKMFDHGRIVCPRTSDGHWLMFSID